MKTKLACMALTRLTWRRFTRRPCSSLRRTRTTRSKSFLTAMASCPLKRCKFIVRLYGNENYA
jgi:hypothetical protein